MFNQKNKVTRSDYERWRAGQDEAAARIAADPDRLLFHVEPELGWLNDPNGLVQVGDTYHIYHQYDPFDAPAWWSRPLESCDNEGLCDVRESWAGVVPRFRFGFERRVLWVGLYARRQDSLLLYR